MRWVTVNITHLLLVCCLLYVALKELVLQKGKQRFRLISLHTSTHTNVHACTHTHKLARIQAHTQTCTHTSTHTNVHARTHTHKRAHTHARTHAHTNVQYAVLTVPMETTCAPSLTWYMVRYSSTSNTQTWLDRSTSREGTHEHIHGQKYRQKGR